MEIGKRYYLVENFFSNWLDTNASWNNRRIAAFYSCMVIGR